MEHKIGEIYRLFKTCPSVSTDSRKVETGSLFFALKGESFNGNEYALQALESGAAYSIVDEERYAVNNQCILVDDVLSTLQALANHHRMQFNIPVVAITGTNGKTTTKELISSVLSEKYNILATKGNLNNHIGVPLTLLNLTSEIEIAIIEMGANHPGEINFLCNIALPGYGIITNIGKAHLEGFGGFEGVIRTKTELYRFIGRTGGKIFLNVADPLLRELSAGLDAVTYGTSGATLASDNLSANPYVEVNLTYAEGTCQRIESKLYGYYNGNNLLAAACVGQHFQVPPAQIKHAIEAYQPDNNRSQVTRTTRNLVIMDAYNANPTSMKAALDAFAGSDYPDKVVVLGDMLELGADTDNEHQEILKVIDSLPFNRVYLVGPVFTRLNTKRENTCFQDSELAKFWLDHHKIENSTILLKGSRGIRLEKLVELL